MLERRQLLMTLGAAGAGIFAAGVPDVLQGRHQASAAGPGGGPHQPAPGHGHGSPTPTARKDPGYAQGLKPLKPGQAAHTLADLTPPPPPTAIALTLDDGPHPTFTPMVLDVLAQYKVPATFSMIGVQVTESPDLVRRVVNAGHQISNHTVTHPLNLPHLTTAKMTQEITGCWDRISHVTGVQPKFFRSPGGNWSPAILETAAAHGMTCLDWAIDPRDWDQPRSTVAHISQTWLTAKAGDILLGHDGGGIRKRTIEALKIAIPQLQKRGFTFVAL